jgi:hypothetical protein
MSSAIATPTSEAAAIVAPTSTPTLRVAVLLKNVVLMKILSGIYAVAWPVEGGGRTIPSPPSCGYGPSGRKAFNPMNSDMTS